MENTDCLNIDKDCQVEIFLTVKNEVKPFICNRYIYVDKKVCDAEVQTEITSNSKCINYNSKRKHQRRLLKIIMFRKKPQQRRNILMGFSYRR